MLNSQAVNGSSNIESLAYLLSWQSLLKLFLAYTKGTERGEGKGIWDVKHRDLKKNQTHKTLPIPSVSGVFKRDPLVWQSRIIELDINCLLRDRRKVSSARQVLQLVIPCSYETTDWGLHIMQCLCQITILAPCYLLLSQKYRTQWYLFNLIAVLWGLINSSLQKSLTIFVNMFVARHCTFSSKVYKRQMTFAFAPKVLYNNLFQKYKFLLSL